MRQLYPFSTVVQAIRYYTLKNPTRQKYTNILEPDKTPAPRYEDFSGESSTDIWASVATAIGKILKKAPKLEYWSFVWWHLAERGVRTEKGQDFSKESIASQLGIKKSQVNKHIRNVESDLAKELVRRELLNPDVLKPDYTYDRSIN